MGLSEDAVPNATLLRSVILVFPPIKTNIGAEVAGTQAYEVNVYEP